MERMQGVSRECGKREWCPKCPKCPGCPESVGDVKMFSGILSEINVSFFRKECRFLTWIIHEKWMKGENTSKEKVSGDASIAAALRH